MCVQGKINDMKRIKTIDKIYTFLSILVIVLYPCLFMYFQNADEAKLTDAFPAAGKFLALAIVTFIICVLFMRKLEKAALLTDIVMFICINFNTFFGKISLLIGKKIVLLLCMAVFALCGFFIKKRGRNEGKVCLILGMCFSILIAINLIIAIPDIVSKITYTKTEGDTLTTEFTEEKPDVYYFIYDEYAGQQGLQRYYEYDNQEFLGELRKLGFNISDTSYNTESYSTTVNVPNLLNISYVAGADEIEANNLKYMKNPKLINIFKSNGYSINLINHTDFLDDTDCNVLITSGQIDTISTYIIQKSIIQVFEDYYAEFMKDDSEIGQYVASLKNILGTMKICVTLTEDDKPTLTVGYISCPHVPFVFDEKGNTLDKSEIHNWENKNYYLNQLEYMNTCILETVNNILEEDREAIIILQSDHGVRYPVHMEELGINTEYEIDSEIPYMENILNCVYYKGEKIDIEGKTGINTLRTVLNEAFKTSYDMIEN